MVGAAEVFGILIVDSKGLGGLIYGGTSLDHDNEPVAQISMYFLVLFALRGLLTYHLLVLFLLLEVVLVDPSLLTMSSFHNWFKSNKFITDMS